MQFQGVRPDLVKFEMRQTTGTPAWVPEAKKPGFFGRLLSGLGRIVGAVAVPLSFVFPPAALVAAGSYGGATIGDMVQAKAQQRVMEANAQRAQQAGYIPGLGVDQPGVMPASAAIGSPYNHDVMNVLFTRGDASLSMAHELK